MKVFPSAWAVAGFVLCPMWSCVEHNIEQPNLCVSQDEISYIDEVNPIIISKCAVPDCHNGDNGNNLNWTIFDNLKGRAEEVQRRILLPASDPDHMPRRGALSGQEIQKIVCWVEQGAQNN